MPYICKFCAEMFDHTTEYAKHLASPEHKKKAKLAKHDSSDDDDDSSTEEEEEEESTIKLEQQHVRNEIHQIPEKPLQPQRYLELLSQGSSVPLKEQTTETSKPKELPTTNQQPSIPLRTVTESSPTQPQQNKPSVNYQNQQQFIHSETQPVQQQQYENQFIPGVSVHNNNIYGTLHGTASPTIQPGFKNQQPLFQQSYVKPSNSLFSHPNDPIAAAKTEIHDNYYCKPCQIQCNSAETFYQHQQGKTHLKKLRLYSQAEFFATPAQPSHSPTTYSSSSSQPSQASFQSNGMEFVEVQGLSRYICTLCQVVCNGPEVLRNHLDGKQHSKALKRESLNAILVNSAPPVDDSDIDELANNFKKATVVPPNANISPDIPKDGTIISCTENNEPGFKCIVCEAFCNSIDSLNDHVIGKKHAKNVKMWTASKLRENIIPQHIPMRGTQPTMHSMPSQSSSSGSQDDDYDFDASRSVQILEYFWDQIYRCKPRYREIVDGPPHKRSFKCEIDIPINNDIQIASAPGDTKKEAKRRATIEACKMLSDLDLLQKIVPDYLYYDPNKLDKMR